MSYTDIISAYEIYVNEFYVNFTKGDFDCARSSEINFKRILVHRAKKNESFKVNFYKFLYRKSMQIFTV